MGNGAYTVGLAWTVYSLTGSSAIMGVLLALNAVPELALVMIGGTLGDRLSRRAIVIVADSVAGATLAVLALFASLQILGIAALATAALILGVVSAFYSPAYSAMNRDLLRAEQLRAANSIITICKNAAQVAGPALAGVVYAVGGPKAIFGLDSFSFAAAVVAMCFTRIPREKKARGGKSILDEAKQGFLYTMRISWMRSILVLSMVANVACLAPFFVLLADLVREQHKGVYMLGWLTSAQVLAAIASAIIIGASKRRLKRPSVALLATAAVLGTGTLLLGASSGITGLLFAGAVLVGIGFSFDVIENTLIQALVPAEFLSRVYGVNMVVSFALLPAGYALSGVLAAMFGPTWVLAMGGAFLISACAWASASRSLREADIVGNIV